MAGITQRRKKRNQVGDEKIRFVIENWLGTIEYFGDLALESVEKVSWDRFYFFFLCGAARDGWD